MSTDIVTTNPQYTGNKLRILELLGNGVSPEHTASTVGVTPAYVSQLLSEEDFAMAVTARRFERLQKHNARDDSLDALEDRLIEKLRDILPMMYKPAEILRAFQVVNAAKRRGSGADGGASSNVIGNQVVNLTIPVVLKQTFVKDINNQVVEVAMVPETKSLVTMQSQNLKALLAMRKQDSTDVDAKIGRSSIPSGSSAATGGYSGTPAPAEQVKSSSNAG